MSDVEINISESRASSISSAAKSKAGFRIFFDLFSMNRDKNKGETPSIQDESKENPIEPLYCSIELSDKEAKADTCSHLYYTICFGLWILLAGGYLYIVPGSFFVILALLGIYLNVALMPEKRDETGQSFDDDDNVCCCGERNIRIEADLSQKEVMVVAGPSTMS